MSPSFFIYGSSSTTKIHSVKFAIIGSGAVGGYFGARLHEAGHTVYFLARGSHLEAIRKNGLQIKSVAGDYKALNVESHESVQTIPSVDVVLVAVKAWQVSEIAPKLKSLAKGSTSCLFAKWCRSSWNPGRGTRKGTGIGRALRIDQFH